MLLFSIYIIFLKTHYDKEERLTFIAQRFARVLTAFFDERTKVELSGHLLCEQTKQLLRGTDPWAIAMRRKYGYFRSIYL